ncbi:MULTISPECIES: hypothetical protein [Streptomyces]|uniref:Vegetative cell wall protein gp1 n=1 Tax=Streptomyces pacificus TaxID=2705029 RepID=A0A6A0B041_9ACTN|nr:MULTISPECIES: hypothetical protein [Streptomyces]GFH38496.1 hypothetical protein SCWH03_47380 [Streptomyces pacificus]
MNTFLSELGKKLAERWVSVLALPGALFTALVTAGSVLGHRDALDWRRLARAAEDFIAHFDLRPVQAVLLSVVILGVGAGIGLLARGLGGVVERVWLLSGPVWLTGRLIRRRQDRWRRAHSAVESASTDERVSEVDRAALAEARNAIALTQPARPTWIGDRLRGVGVRVHGQYGLDFPYAWPRLWTLLPETCRNDLIAARAALTGASIQGGWGLLYLCLGTQWWPAALVGAVLLLIGWRRGREAATNLADLTESAVDLYAADLALSLGVDLPSGYLTPALGRQISERLRKGT